MGYANETNQSQNYIHLFLFFLFFTRIVFVIHLFCSLQWFYAPCSSTLFSVHVPNPLFEVCWPASQLGETHQLHRCLSYSIQVVWKASELE